VKVKADEYRPPNCPTDLGRIPRSPSTLTSSPIAEKKPATCSSLVILTINYIPKYIVEAIEGRGGLTNN
jgi:hypothetical protein